MSGGEGPIKTATRLDALGFVDFPSLNAGSGGDVRGASKGKIGQWDYQ